MVSITAISLSNELFSLSNIILGIGASPILGRCHALNALQLTGTA